MGTAVAVLVAVVIVIVIWRVARSNENVAVCGDQTLQAKFAVGDNTDWVLTKPAGEFATAGPSCLKPTEAQKLNKDKRSAFFCVSNTPGEGALDPINGVDSVPIFFFFGHGDENSQETWTVGADQVFPTCMRIGDPVVGGKLRYYFQCSCQVFAHGPVSFESVYPDYRRPWRFTEGPKYDSAAFHNLYRRWGPVLRRGARLVCGLSSTMSCSQEQVAKAMLDKEAFFDVTDSFLEGLRVSDVDEPICLTAMTGDERQPEPMKTPLYDHSFTAEPRQKTDGRSGYYLLEYVRTSAGDRPLPPLPRILDVFALPELSPEAEYRLVPEGAWEGALRSVSRFLARGISWWRSRRHIYNDSRVSLVPVAARCPEDGDSKCGAESFFVSKAEAFLGSMGWREGDTEPRPEVLRLVVNAYPIDDGGLATAVSWFQKAVIVRYRRLVAAGRSGGSWGDPSSSIVIEMDRLGRVANAWKSWRPLGKVVSTVQLKKGADEYRRVAIMQLAAKAEGYQITQPPELLYLAQGENLVPFLRYIARPRKPNQINAFPPVRLDVALWPSAAQ